MKKNLDSKKKQTKFRYAILPEFLQQRSVFRSGGTCERTLVPVFVPGEHPPKPPFGKTTLLGSSELKFALSI